MRRCDVLIVGGGLAGCVLAQELQSRGHDSLVVDRNDPVTSSKIAAGLLTPVTGQRLTVAWGWHEFRRAAGDFYRRLEQKSGESLFRELEMARLFASESERNWFESKRRDNPAYSDVVDRGGAWEEFFKARESMGIVTGPWGGFVMRGGARLDVRRMLDLTRDEWIQRDRWINADISDSELHFDAGGVTVERLQVHANRVVLCRGAVEATDPTGHWFPRQDLRPSKGEILSARIPGWKEHRVIHGGVWIVPEPDGSVKIGATYDWASLDGAPTAAGRAELLEQAQLLVRSQIGVTGQQAAVRPTPRAYRPLVGLHPAQPRLAVFNGLGSRGSLQAPALASRLADILFHRADPIPECQPSHWLSGHGARQ